MLPVQKQFPLIFLHFLLHKNQYYNRALKFPAQYTRCSAIASLNSNINGYTRESVTENGFYLLEHGSCVWLHCDIM